MVHARSLLARAAPQYRHIAGRRRARRWHTPGLRPSLSARRDFLFSHVCERERFMELEILDTGTTEMQYPRVEPIAVPGVLTNVSADWMVSPIHLYYAFIVCSHAHTTTAFKGSRLRWSALSLSGSSLRPMPNTLDLSRCVPTSRLCGFNYRRTLTVECTTRCHRELWIV